MWCGVDLRWVRVVSVCGWLGLSWNAAFGNNVNGMQQALSEGANVNARDFASGQTAFMGAVLRGHVNVAKYLLEEHNNLGVDLLLPEKDGYTAAHGAAFQGRSEIMKLLIHHNVNVKDDFHSDGYAPVHRVCWGNTGRHAETLKVLRDEGGVDIANLASRHKEGKVCRQMTNNPTIFALLEETLSAQDHTAPSQDEL